MSRRKKKLEVQVYMPKEVYLKEFQNKVNETYVGSVYELLHKLNMEEEKLEQVISKIEQRYCK